MNFLLLIKSALVGLLLLMPALNARAETLPVVVELFTSEGCSSCPPAEALLRDLADMPGVLALEFHVDYWDYIGWPDPYADSAFTQRQRRYAQLFDSRTVYTPQMVFQGASETVGSRTGQVMDHIERSRALPKTPVSLTMVGDNQIELTIDAINQQVDTDLLLVTYDDYRETQVTRGENAGKFLTHRHVVRSIETIGSWNGALLRLTLPVPETMSESAGCAVLIQARNNGHILGAANLTLGP